MAGRKKLNDNSERVVRVNITIKPSQIEWLNQHGGISASISKIWAKFDSSKHPANIIRFLLRQPSSYSQKTSEIYYGKLTASIIKTDPYSIFKSA